MVKYGPFSLSLTHSNVSLFRPLPVREDLACRLPELEQPGSDQENLDSEASLSSESLLDDQQRSSSAHGSEEAEGWYWGSISLLGECPWGRFLFVGFWPVHWGARWPFFCCGAGLDPWWWCGGGGVCSIAKQVGGTATPSLSVSVCAWAISCTNYGLACIASHAVNLHSSISFQ